MLCHTKSDNDDSSMSDEELEEDAWIFDRPPAVTETNGEKNAYEVPLPCSNNNEDVLLLLQRSTRRKHPPPTS